jgi:hypothetical protein
MSSSELEARIRRLEDIEEITKLQSRYQHLLLMYDWPAIEALFARKAADVSVEISDSGVYVGTTGVKRMFERIWSARKGKTGTVLLHHAVNPVIEVNKDGKTAKGLWHSPSTLIATDNGKPVTSMGLGKYQVDYIKEDGEWKFWHMKYYHIIAMDKIWEDKGMGAVQRSLRSAYSAFKPDRPRTLETRYDPDKAVIFQPPPPKPEK